jgi:two-component system cell cycle response regulator DivK
VSIKLLVVEDNPDNLKLVSWILEDEGYAFDAATSGEECLEKLAVENYHLVLLDISLPGIDGKETARRIRADARFRTLPIIACTAHAIKQESAGIMESGFDCIVTKPIDEQVLLDCLRQYLKQ